jgi:hypothetical protein
MNLKRLFHSVLFLLVILNVLFAGTMTISFNGHEYPDEDDFITNILESEY